MEKLLEVIGRILGLLISKPLFKTLEAAEFTKDFVCAAIEVYRDRKETYEKYLIHDQSTLLKEFCIKKKKFEIHKNNRLSELNITGACTIMGMKENLIFVDDAFLDKCSENLQRFAVLHEAGHIMNNDFIHFGWKMLLSDILITMGSAIKIKGITAGRILDSELLADGFAAGIMGTPAALQAVKELYDITYNDELRYRYHKLGGDFEDIPLHEPPEWSFVDIHVENNISLDDLDDM